VLSKFDPYEVLQQHDNMLTELIEAHNNVAKLQEDISVSIVKLDQRIDKIQRLILRNIDETK
jgi:phosphate uptake regulator